jgi:hypothetical protein
VANTARYVMVGFSTGEQALEFLNYLDSLPDDQGRYFHTAQKQEGKWLMRRFRIMTAYLKE